MPSRLQRTLQALILAGLGLFLLHKLWSGNLYWYINDRFFGLVLAAAIGFLILARTVLPAWRSADAPAERAHTHAADEPHGAAHTHKASAWRLGLVALPLILGLLVPAQPLGSSALANKGLNTSAPMAASDGAAASSALVPPAERTVLDWVRAFNMADSNANTAQTADVIGFVYHDPGLAAGEFIVARFAVTCCAADAVGFGMRVQWPAASALESDAWVRIQGPVTTGAYAGRAMPVIVAESVEGIEAPVQPYLYP